MKIVLFLLATLSLNCWAYYDVVDTAETMNPGQYKLTGSGQVITDHGGGLNLTGAFDTGIQQDWAVRGLFGFGKTDYYLGGMVKWVPIPDTEGQPGLGGNLGITYGRWHDTSETTFRVEPLISKKFSVSEGGAMLTPYASIPVGIRIRDNKRYYDDSDSTQVTFQLAGGAQLQVEKWKNLQFIGEIGVDLSNTFSYVTLGAIFYWDGEKGMVLE